MGISKEPVPYSRLSSDISAVLPINIGPSFLYVIASYIIPSYNIASYNVIRQAVHAQGAAPPPHVDRSGKCIPFWSQKLGRSFRQARHPESASRSEPEFWDALSAKASTGKRIPF